MSKCVKWHFAWRQEFPHWLSEPLLQGFASCRVSSSLPNHSNLPLFDHPTFCPDLEAVLGCPGAQAIRCGVVRLIPTARSGNGGNGRAPASCHGSCVEHDRTMAGCLSIHLCNYMTMVTMCMHNNTSIQYIIYIHNMCAGSTSCSDTWHLQNLSQALA